MDYTLSLSYGKDSLACLGAIEELGWPLTRIIHAEVWATDSIPADLPPMVEFKAKADKIIYDRWGIKVEHVRHSMSYEEMFLRPICRGPNKGKLKGWPLVKGGWCRQLKVFNKLNPSGSISYIGIASDEPSRFHNLSDVKRAPLVAAGWDEAFCRSWCENHDLLSPIYTSSLRGGCWFCHNQSIDQLRFLRLNYPDYWSLMLHWDSLSPVSFRADGHTLHDFEERFQLEDQGLLFPYDSFHWNDLSSELNYRWF